MTEPKTAMETAAVTTMRIRLPSHTRRRGARADFGRLFNRTKKGSNTWAARGSDQRKRAVIRLIRVHKKKLTRVSVNVTPVWRKRLLSKTKYREMEYYFEI